MDAPMSKADLLAAMETGHQDWQVLLATVGEARMYTPGAQGDWSVKDIVAHVAWYEREIAGVMRAHALVGSEHWNLGTHARNELLAAATRDQPAAVALAAEQTAYAELAAAVAALDEADLTDAGRFRDMPAGWQPWTLVAENSYLHYPEHIQAIRAWIERDDGR